MVDALPNPNNLKKLVPNGTGFLGGGLQRENWERAMVQITRVCIKDVSHPGINYLIKHVGCIFRRLFTLSLEDIKQGEEFSSTFKLMPNAVEKYLNDEFDTMLWSLLKNAADKTHGVLEPMYSTVDPNLPTFHVTNLDDDTSQAYFIEKNGKYEPANTSKESQLESITAKLTRKFSTLLAFNGSGTGMEAKSFLKSENRDRAMTKKAFLSDERTAMITGEETDKIIRRSFEYMVALMEFNIVILKFQLNHFLYQGFKDEISRSFTRKIGGKADWTNLVAVDPALTDQLEKLKEQIAGLTASLHEVQRMYRKI